MHNYICITISILLIFSCVSSGKVCADEMYYPVGTNPITSAPPFAGETFYPEGPPATQKYGVNFWKYNDESGALDLNLTFLKKDKLYISPPVVSPDFNNIMYTEVYYFAGENEVVSRCFYIPVVLPEPSPEKPDITIDDYYNSYNVRCSDQNRYEVLSVNTKIPTNNIFRTLTIVDWAYDSDRVLIKEHIGQMGQGIVGTIIWVYEVKEDKIYRIDTIRRAVINFWLKKENLDLTRYVWDIDVLGWEVNSKNRFVVNAYLYPTRNKRKFLGCWSIDINANLSQLLSTDNENWKVDRNGLIPF